VKRALCLVLGGALAACSAQSPEASESATADRFPRMAVSRGGQDLLGTAWPAVSFDRWLRGAADPSAQVTLYRWWTDTCPYCAKSLPAIETLRKQYESRGLRTVAVYHPKPPHPVRDAAVLDHLRSAGYGGAVALDEDWSVLRSFYLGTGERRATSATFLVDTRGVIRFVHPGPQFFESDRPAERQADQDYRLLDRAVDRLLHEAAR